MLEPQAMTDLLWAPLLFEASPDHREQVGVTVKLAGLGPGQGDVALPVEVRQSEAGGEEAPHGTAAVITPEPAAPKPVAVTAGSGS